MGGGVDRWIGAEKISVAGEGVVGLAVDEEADAGNLGKRCVESADDRLHGKGFDLDSGGVIVYEGAVKVDDG